MSSQAKNTWVCINCGRVLGMLIGQELEPESDVKLRTQGANLLITCPNCDTRKTWFPADPLVRVMKQLIDVIASETARSAVYNVGRELAQARRESKKSIGE